MFVTHDQTEALATGDRVAVMRAGRIEQLGTPTDVFHARRSRFVAGFMGDASFLPIRRDGDAPRTELGAAVDDARRRDRRRTVVAVARPDDVTFEPAPTARPRSSAPSSAARRGATRCASPSGTVVRSSRSHLVRVADRHTGAVSLVPGHRLVAVADDGDGR